MPDVRKLAVAVASVLSMLPLQATAQPDAGTSPDAGIDSTIAPDAGTGEAPEQPPEAAAEEAPEQAADDALPRPESAGPTVDDRDPEELDVEESADVDADAELQGRPIGRIDFTCDLSVCSNPISIEAFREIMGLHVGQSYSTEILRRAEVRLAKTGFFSKIAVTKTLSQDAVFLDIEAEGATLIRKVFFQGVKAPPFESDLRKLLSYRQGQAFREDAEKATAQLESLEAIYEREGYFGTQISMIVQDVADREHQVDLIFRINKGEQRRICGVGLRGVKAMAYEDARDLLLSDFSFLPRRLNIFPLHFTERDFRNGQKALIDAYRRRGYFQARITQSTANVSEATRCVDLAVDLAEGPRWNTRFVGADLFSDAELSAQLPFYESGYVDSEEIRRASRAIEKLYETRGYSFATVRGRETQNDRLDRVLEFTIDEGPQIEIAEIVFHGNRHVDAAVLREGLGTRPFGLFETGGYLQTDQLLGDFTRIEATYRERGYLQAVVDSFSVELLDRRDAIRVHVYIDEGPRTMIERVDIDGNRIFTDPVLLRGLSGRPGRPFVPVELKGDLTKLLQKYSELGYPMTRVQTTCRLLTGEEVPCQAPRMKRGCAAKSLEELDGRCNWVDGDDTRRFVCQRRRDDEECAFRGGATRDRVAIVHTVSEGPRVTVGPILLKGNFSTKSPVIYREVPLERGALLDTQRVISAQGNLRSLNLFDSVSIETVGLDEGVRDEDAAVAALLINVEESRTREIDFEFGVELRDVLSETRQLLLTGQGEYTDRNLGGRGFGIQPRLISAVDTLDIARVASGVAADFETASEITTVDYVVGSELIFSHPRFLKSAFGIDKLYATLSPFYIIDLVGVINRQVLREEFGVRLEFRKELFEVLSRFFLKLGVEAKSIASFAQGGPVVDGARVFSPRRTIGKVTPDFALDRRDSPLNPRKGFIARLVPAVVSGNALGRGRERFITDSFLRLTSAFSFYIPLWKDFVVGQSLRAGQIFPLFDREIPVEADELYFLGGVSSVRGFPDGHIGPLGASQRPGGGEFLLNYNIELRYPLLREYSLYGATFFDAGLLADCRDESFEGRDCYSDAFDEDPLESIRTATGVGLRAVFFDQIPVVLDYGIVLNRVPGERFGQLHLNVGYTFD